MERTVANTFITDFKPKKAIAKMNIHSHVRIGKIYAQKHECITIVELRGEVAICVKDNGDWFPTNVKNLTII
jgi:hypothetical protein